MKNKITSLLMGAALLSASPSFGFSYPDARPIPDAGKLVFQILRDGQPFGMHVINFDQQGDEVTAEIEIDMDFSLGPLTLFSYDHDNREIWRGGKPQMLEATTDDDGDNYKVSASWNGAALQVEKETPDAQEAYDAPATIYPTSYWNPSYLSAGQLLNTQKGKLEEITITPLGTERFEIEGAFINADRYGISASVPIEVLHDAKTGQWVGLEFEVRGSQITYRRLTPITIN